MYRCMTIFNIRVHLLLTKFLLFIASHLDSLTLSRCSLLSCQGFSRKCFVLIHTLLILMKAVLRLQIIQVHFIGGKIKANLPIIRLLYNTV